MGGGGLYNRKSALKTPKDFAAVSSERILHSGHNRGCINTLHLYGNDVCETTIANQRIIDSADNKYYCYADVCILTLN